MIVPVSDRPVKAARKGEKGLRYACSKYRTRKARPKGCLGKQCRYEITSIDQHWT